MPFRCQRYPGDMGHDAKVAGMRRNLEDKTGKTVDGWHAALAGAGIADKKAARAFLKEAGVGHFQVRLVLSEWTPAAG